jgi:hypothetical protein
MVQVRLPNHRLSSLFSFCEGCDVLCSRFLHRIVVACTEIAAFRPF